VQNIVDGVDWGRRPESLRTVREVGEDAWTNKEATIQPVCATYLSRRGQCHGVADQLSAAGAPRHY
jgi:hypothetical protein